MTRRRYELGQIVFAEDDESGFVGLIAEGEAEVSRRHGGEDVVIGYLQAGDYFGEMAAIEGGPHAATVRAAGPLAIECFETSEFLRRVSGDSDLAFHLLERLSRRLRRMDDAYAAAVTANRALATDPAHARSKPAGRSGGDGAPATLFPASDRIAAAIPAGGLALNNLPFTVGRRPARFESSPRPPVDLMLEDSLPYRLSRRHFEILREDGSVKVRDLNSHLGTIVNGASIGRFFPRDTVELTPGDNSIVAGGTGSPYAFRVVLQG